MYKVKISNLVQITVNTVLTATTTFSSCLQRLPSREKLEASYRPTSRDSDVFLAGTKAAEDVFVKVEVLHPKDCFVSTVMHFSTETELFF